MQHAAGASSGKGGAVLLLAFGSFACLAIQLGVQILPYPEERAPIYVLQFAAAITAVVACATWLAWRHWRKLLLFAGLVYLVLYLLRFVSFVAWKIEHWSLPEAIWKTIEGQRMLVVHFFANGWVLEGIGVLFYEWLMPLFAGVIIAALVWPLTVRRTPTRAEAARAG